MREREYVSVCLETGKRERELVLVLGIQLSRITRDPIVSYVSFSFCFCLFFLILSFGEMSGLLLWVNL